MGGQFSITTANLKVNISEGLTRVQILHTLSVNPNGQRFYFIFVSRLWHQVDGSEQLCWRRWTLPIVQHRYPGPASACCASPTGDSSRSASRSASRLSIASLPGLTRSRTGLCFAKPTIAWTATAHAGSFAAARLRLAKSADSAALRSRCCKHGRDRGLSPIRQDSASGRWFAGSPSS